jgi:Ca-activated chloride channel family protein
MFANPLYLWFFAFVPALLLVHFFSLKRIERNAMMFANYKAMEHVFGTRILSKNYPLLMIRVLTLVFLILAVSGFVLVYEGAVTDFDFTIAIDATASMMAQDYDPDRLTAAKEAAQLFVDTLPIGTKVGVLSFSGTGFVGHQLTDSKDDIKKAIDDVDIVIAGGTALGEAIVSSTDVLLYSEKKKSIVLLTDGENNIGISIDDALEYAKRFDVVVNTIGIGTEEGAVIGETTFYVGLDEETLRFIANETGGGFYRARTEQELLDAFESIAAGGEERVHLDLTTYLMLVALVLFLAELVMVNTKYRTIP